MATATKKTESAEKSKRTLGTALSSALAKLSDLMVPDRDKDSGGIKPIRPGNRRSGKTRE